MTSTAYDERVASQPDAVQRLLDDDPVPALDASRPVVFSGIGTSPHACRVAAVRSRAELTALVANIADRPVVWPQTDY